MIVGLTGALVNILDIQSGRNHVQCSLWLFVIPLFDLEQARDN